MSRNAKKTSGTGGRSAGGTAFRPCNLAVPVMGQDQAAEIGDLECVVVALGSPCRARRRASAAGRAGLPIALHRRDLDRLILQSVEAVQIAEHAPAAASAPAPSTARSKAGAREFEMAPLPQIKAADADHDKGAGDIGGGHHVGEAVRERRIEDRRPPAGELELAVRRDGESGRRLHPAVGGENPKGADDGAERDCEHEKKWSRGPTRSMPNSMTPMKPASRKKAIRTS